MSLEDPTRERNREPSSDPRFVFRMIGASIFFLLVGLGVMWFYFAIQETPPVRLEGGIEPPPPVFAAQPTAPNRVRMYFTTDGATLSPETREITPRDASTHARASAIVQALLEGPHSSGLRSPIPRSVTLIGLYLQDQEATLDFSSQLRDDLAPSIANETLCAYAIVNSVLLNCPDLKSVTVLIEGQPVATLRGAIDLSAPLVQNLALIPTSERERS